MTENCDSKPDRRTRPRFRAALPHQLDGPGPTKADLPLYIERVGQLEAELEAARGRYESLAVGRDAESEANERLRAENERLREAGAVAVDVLGAMHIVEEGPNARWVEYEDKSDGYYEEDLVCRADCAVCAAKRGLETALPADEQEATG